MPKKSTTRRKQVKSKRSEYTPEKLKTAVNAARRCYPPEFVSHVVRQIVDNNAGKSGHRYLGMSIARQTVGTWVTAYKKSAANQVADWTPRHSGAPAAIPDKVLEKWCAQINELDNLGFRMSTEDVAEHVALLLKRNPKMKKVYDRFKHGKPGAWWQNKMVKRMERFGVTVVTEMELCDARARALNRDTIKTMYSKLAEVDKRIRETLGWRGGIIAALLHNADETGFDMETGSKGRVRAKRKRPLGSSKKRYRRNRLASVKQPRVSSMITLSAAGSHTIGAGSKPEHQVSERR